MDCIFCGIIKGQIPAEIQYEDENIIAFKDIHPQAPVHSLIVPRQHVNTLNDLSVENMHIMSSLAQTAKHLAKEFGIDSLGYRVIVNCNRGAGQTIFHLHMHLLGGKTLSERMV